MESSSENLGAMIQLISAPFRRKPIPAFLSPSISESLESLPYDRLPTSSLSTSKYPNTGKWTRRKRKFRVEVQRLLRKSTFVDNSSRRKRRHRPEHTNSQRVRCSYEYHPYNTSRAQAKHGYENTVRHLCSRDSIDQQIEVSNLVISRDCWHSPKKRTILRKTKARWADLKANGRILLKQTGKSICFWTVEVGSYILLAPVLIPWEILTLLGLLLLRIWTRCREFQWDTFLIKVRDRSGWIGEGGWVGMAIGLLLGTGGRYINKVHH